MLYALQTYVYYSSSTQVLLRLSSSRPLTTLFVFGTVARSTTCMQKTVMWWLDEEVLAGCRICVRFCSRRMYRRGKEKNSPKNGNFAVVVAEKS